MVAIPANIKRSAHHVIAFPIISQFIEVGLFDVIPFVSVVVVAFVTVACLLFAVERFAIEFVVALIVFVFAGSLIMLYTSCNQN